MSMPDDGDLDDVYIDKNMACAAFKLVIFYNFRHALTRHDPKTYLA